MPKVARNYQREDFLDLLVQMQHPAAEPESERLPREPKKKIERHQVSPERRRRDSLMSNRAMRYAYSSVEKRLHDRDCAEVSKIPDTEFEMLTEYRTDLKRCWLCGRRAIVRAGISCDDAKAYGCVDRSSAAVWRNDRRTLRADHRQPCAAV